MAMLSTHYPHLVAIRDTRTVTENLTDDHLVHRDVVSLKVGDDVYAFERYTPRGKEVDGMWYRGYANQYNTLRNYAHSH